MEKSSSGKQRTTIWTHYNSNDAVSFELFKYGEYTYMNIKRHHKDRSGHHVISNNMYALNDNDVTALINGLMTARINR